MLYAARHILEDEVANSTLVIHKDDRSTDFLKAIYDGRGYPVITGDITRQELLHEIERFPRVFMLGHGGPTGLFGPGYIIDKSFGPALAKKPDGLYIWCNADAYAKANGLTGLVSGMFISEVGEAAMFGIRATQAEVDASNNMFSRLVRETMDRGEPVSAVRQCYAKSNAACKITQFNSERLYVFDNGAPTPALHPSSLAHEEDRWKERQKEWEKQHGKAADQFVRDPEHEELFDIGMEDWHRTFEQLADEMKLDVWTLSQDEEDFIEDCYYDGYSAQEAVEMLLRARQKQEAIKPRHERPRNN